MADKSEQTVFTRRIVVASSVVCLLLGLLILRLWYLQAVYGAYYRDLSENNRKRTVRTLPPRGTIFDREEKVLVRNRPSFDVALILEDTPNVAETLKTLAQITGRDVEQLRKQLQTLGKSRHFEPRIVMADVTREELAKVKVNSYRLPGVIINTVPARAYPGNTLAAQVLGYAREITKSQLDAQLAKNEKADYKTGDLIGQAGLEKQLEDSLRGKSGYIQVEVDAMGHRRGELGIVDDLIGDDLYLTLDEDLQRAAETALGDRRGAVVGIDPRNGEVLVLASTPAYDVNMFSGKMKAQEWEQVSADRNKPLNNRAISSKYPPGSTFKLFMAMAALAEKKVTPATEVNCPGFFMLGGRPYRCHKRSGHGPVNMEKAITVSCNAYFYHIGQLLGITGIYKFGHMFGFGEPTGIDLPGEDPGILPSEEWKRTMRGDKWYPGDTIPVSIGQGYLNVTPIQMAVAISAIANGGTVFRPYLVKRIVDHATGETKVFGPEAVRNVPMERSVFETMKRYSVSVVNNERGTGKRAALPGVTVAGKTGTAQTSVLGKENLGERFKDHAWFISFAPADDPMIAMAVIVENSGHGGEFAAPVTRQVMEVYFRKLGMLNEEAAKQQGAKVDQEPVEPEEETDIDAENPDAEPAESTAAAENTEQVQAATPTPAPTPAGDE